MCKGHDALDWFAAIGPTLAAFFAAWVAWRTYQNGAKLQRQLTRPLVSIRHNYQRHGKTNLRWVAELRNDGHSGASIERFSVFARGERVELGVLQSADEFWEGMFTNKLGALRLVRHAPGNAIRPPLGLAPASSITLFDINFAGESKDFANLISNFEIRLKIRSPLGEEFDYISRAD